MSVQDFVQRIQQKLKQGAQLRDLRGDDVEVQPLEVQRARRLQGGRRQVAGGRHRYIFGVVSDVFIGEDKSIALTVAGLIRPNTTRHYPLPAIDTSAPPTSAFA